MSPLSEARKRATAKYNAKTYDRIEVKVPKGKKEQVQDHAAAAGESLNAFVSRAIDETMQRDTGAPEQPEADTPAQGEE